MEQLRDAPKNTTIVKAEKQIEDNGKLITVNVLRCVPNLRRNIMSATAIGNTTKLSVQSTSIDAGVDMHAVHEFNVTSGWCESDAQAESLESSLRRTKRVIRELAACNPWDLFVTLTLAPDKWNRMDPMGLQTYIKEQARKWRRKGCDYAYLFVPEPHEDGAVHLHGLVRGIPAEYLCAYTMDDVNSMPLPFTIIDTVNAGEDIYHCTIWDTEVGYNTLTPIRDLDKTAAYITKYITKDLGSLPVKTRLWHSRGLQKAKRLGIYQISDNDMDNAIQFLRSAASTTAHEISLYTECRNFSMGNSLGHFRYASALIDSCDMERSDIMEFLDNQYIKLNEVRKNNE